LVGVPWCPLGSNAPTAAKGGPGSGFFFRSMTRRVNERESSSRERRDQCGRGHAPRAPRAEPDAQGAPGFAGQLAPPPRPARPGRPAATRYRSRPVGQTSQGAGQMGGRDEPAGGPLAGTPPGWWPTTVFERAGVHDTSKRRRRSAPVLAVTPVRGERRRRRRRVRAVPSSIRGRPHGDRELHPGRGRRRRQAVDALLGREAADVADDDFAVGGAISRRAGRSFARSGWNASVSTPRAKPDRSGRGRLFPPPPRGGQ